MQPYRPAVPGMRPGSWRVLADQNITPGREFQAGNVSPAGFYAAAMFARIGANHFDLQQRHHTAATARRAFRVAATGSAAPARSGRYEIGLPSIVAPAITPCSIFQSRAARRIRPAFPAP
jgi:hypothetical protein